MVVHHGELYQRDHIVPRSRYVDRGKFGRLFPTLPPFARDTPAVRNLLMELGEKGGPMDAQDPPPPAPNPNSPDNPRIAGGFTFLGQFLDHDLTFDPTSSLERQSDPEAIENFRTPAFELDSLYASGKTASPHLYDKTTGRDTMLLDAAATDDLPRNSQETAILGDPRNDENLIVSQLHLAFLKFHNAVVEHLRAQDPPPEDLFADAQTLVRWHYQWLIVHEFLPLTVGQALVDEILDRTGGQGGTGPRRQKRRHYDWKNKPFIPVEFAVAAYRFGHSQARPGYPIRQGFAATLFALPTPENPTPDDLSGGRRDPRRFPIDWQNFFAVNGPSRTQSRRIDTLLSTPLLALPFTGPNLPGNPRSLAQRNLLRHLTFALPSGQEVARAMGEEELGDGELDDLQPFGQLRRSTPLWFYVLREADKRANGEHLGPVGGRIVAEVFLGVLEGDRQSYLRQDPAWVPTLGRNPGEFTMVDLLRFAGVAGAAPVPPDPGDVSGRIGELTGTTPLVIPAAAPGSTAVPVTGDGEESSDD